MYIPQHFSEKDLSVLQTLMREYSFATLVSTQQDGVPLATHLPVLYEPQPAPYGALKAHLALGNPQWRTFQAQRDVLVVFQGPHAYITPSWYEAELSVPTWNYAAIHAYGRACIIRDPAALYLHLKALIATHEAQFASPWSPEGLPSDYIERMMKGVVGFEMKITRLEGKLKMSQNRSETERTRICGELRATQFPLHGEVASLVSGAHRAGPPRRQHP
ncbi:MAG TPA: FMN-binding negative transcriptional regulator [Ktedonobacteraceae bacterium]|jgi:transcriptional regulator